MSPSKGIDPPRGGALRVTRVGTPAQTGMSRRSAFYSGVVGALAMSLFAALARAAGLTSVNLEMALGSFFTWRIDFPSWVVGLLLHLFAGGVIGVVYGRILRLLGRSGVRWGLVIAVPHVVLFEVARSWIFPADWHSRIAIALLHLLYGGVVAGRMAADPRGWSWKAPGPRAGRIRIS